MASIATSPDALQQEVIDFLSDARAYGPPSLPVEVRSTHGALVFLVGDSAYKIKRAVRYAYMDFSTLDKRRVMLQRELAINQPHAPEIYLGLVTIARTPHGTLSINGIGEIVEFALHMRRFPESNVLASRARAGVFSTELARDLADTVVASHRLGTAHTMPDADLRMGKILDDVAAQLRQLTPLLPAASVAGFEANARKQFGVACDCLRQRGDVGFVRRCHGDLHLNNIVMWHGRPTLFDALEFDEDLATIDTLYDLAFLLMDLEHHGLRRGANVVLNRYLWKSGDQLDIEGLRALPLFLGLRSAIRAMTNAQRAAQQSNPESSSSAMTARSYLDNAVRYLAPASPRLIAIGGHSGSGKSTVAAALAPDIGPPPGAFHIRTDLERKSLFNTAETEHLPAAGYTREATQKTYAITLEKADFALRSGHSVIIDAAFQRPEDRAAVAALANSASVTFKGLWLTAPRDILLARVAARRNDASDATPEVVESQLTADFGVIDWTIINAAGSIVATTTNARAALTDDPATHLR